MKRGFALIAFLPLIVAATRADEHAVAVILAQMIVGEPIPEALLDRQIGNRRLADLDKTIAAVKGCKVHALDPLRDGSYGVQWHCKGRRLKDQPSAMMIYANGGKVTRITTALMSNR